MASRITLFSTSISVSWVLQQSLGVTSISLVWWGLGISRPLEETTREGQRYISIIGLTGTNESPAHDSVNNVYTECEVREVKKKSKSLFTYEILEIQDRDKGFKVNVCQSGFRDLQLFVLFVISIVSFFTLIVHVPKCVLRNLLMKWIRSFLTTSHPMISKLSMYSQSLNGVQLSPHLLWLYLYVRLNEGNTGYVKLLVWFETTKDSPQDLWNSTLGSGKVNERMTGVSEGWRSRKTVTYRKGRRRGKREGKEDDGRRGIKIFSTGHKDSNSKSNYRRWQGTQIGRSELGVLSRVGEQTGGTKNGPGPEPRGL